MTGWGERLSVVDCTEEPEGFESRGDYQEISRRAKESILISYLILDRVDPSIRALRDSDLDTSCPKCWM